MKQRVIAEGVIVCTGPDGDTVKILIDTRRMSPRSYESSLSSFLLQLPIKPLVKAILEVQKDHEAPASGEYSEDPWV